MFEMEEIATTDHIKGVAVTTDQNPFLKPVDRVAELLDENGVPKVGKSMRFPTGMADLGIEKGPAKTTRERIKRWLTQAAASHNVGARSEFYWSATKDDGSPADGAVVMCEWVVTASRFGRKAAAPAPAAKKAAAPKG